jgi:formylglycine-generating enzyme required for sulfatase activity
VLPAEEAEAIRKANQAWPHVVTLAPFFIGKYELTQAQWRALSGLDPSTYGARRNGAPDKPVESVAWDECRSVLPRAKLRLPTEAQWEYAARGGTETAWWTGNDVLGLAKAGNVADLALYRAHADRTFAFELTVDDGHTTPREVGGYAPNAFGVHDTIGNVAEWCRDGRASYRNAVQDSDGERKDGDPTQRVLRGGGWDGGGAYARSCQRSFNAPSAMLNFVGARAARGLEP